ncbi:MAG: site-specific tyrosine recombinase XerC [Bacteroidetes bacterium]|nr:site-specific tyrosine recombinase XerC [Bacteroidota bacterium]
MEKQLFINELAGTFNLRERKVNKPTNIYFVFRCNNKQYKVSTGVKVYPIYWDSNKKRAIINKCSSKLDRYNNEIVNNAIEEYVLLFKQCKEYIANSSEVTFDNVNQLILKYMNKQNNTNEDNINPFVWFKKINREDRNTKESTKKIYDGDIRLFEEFCNTLKEKIISFKQIDYDLIKKYEDYLQCKGQKSNLRIKMLFKFFKLAEENEYLDLRTNHLNRWKPIKEREEKDTIYLKAEEISKIYNTVINDKKVEYSKDLFILQCEIGQRYSDLCLLSTAKIEENSATIIQTKTGTKVTFPLSERAKEILAKFNYKIVPYDNATYNKHLKIIGKLANINDDVAITNKDGKLEIVPKYSLITSHTARRSFATNALLNGMDMTLLMKLTGHKTTSAFQKYIKASNDDAVNTFLNLKSKNNCDNKEKEETQNISISEEDKKLIDIAERKANIKGMFDDAKTKEEAFRRLNFLIQFAPKDILNEGYIEFVEFANRSSVFKIKTEIEANYFKRLEKLCIHTTISSIEKKKNEIEQKYDVLNKLTEK